MLSVERERYLAMGAYVIFFLPLLWGNRSPFGRFHSNQGLVLLLVYLLFSIVGRLIPVVGKGIIVPFCNLAWLVLAALGIYYAYKGRMKPLPLVGNFKIIK